MSRQLTKPINIQTILARISNGLVWYDQLPQDYNDIPELIASRRRLASLSGMLAQYTGIQMKAHHEARFTRKAQFNKQFLVFKQKTDTNGKFFTDGVARTKAEVAIEGHRKLEANLESEVQAGKLLLDQCSKVLDSMASLINYLKEEYRRVNVEQPI